MKRLTTRTMQHTQLVRRVWALVTVNPRITTREIADWLGCAYSGAAGAVRELADSGYIDVPRGTRRVRLIRTPFYVADIRRRPRRQRQPRYRQARKAA